MYDLTGLVDSKRLYVLNYNSLIYLIMRVYVYIRLDLDLINYLRFLKAKTISNFSRTVFFKGIWKNENWTSDFGFSNTLRYLNITV